MKRLWCRLRELWIDDYEEYDTMQLSRRDKSSLLYGAFMICALTIIAVCIIYNVKVAKANEQTEQEMYTFLNTVTTYLTAATDDEYMEIAEQIRDDLVLSKFSQNIEEYVHYIPNTANGCCAEQEYYSAQAYLICTNTGELYPLDIYDAGEDPSNKEYGYTSMRFAYDEVSETNAHIMLLPDENRSSVTFSQGRGIVSIHRMKGLFCDGCIDKILAAVDNNLMPEYVLFDPANMVYYSISEGTQAIGNYTLTTTYNSKDYEIEVVYANE